MDGGRDDFRCEEEEFAGVEQRLQISRRDFMQFCAAMAATMGLPAGAEAALVKAIEQARRPSAIWLHFQECTGCTESLLRAEHPTLEKLILDVISLDYHETLFAAAGHQAEAARKSAMQAHKGKYLLVVEGAVPVKENGIYCKIGGKTAIDLLKECAADAAALLSARGRGTGRHQLCCCGGLGGHRRRGGGWSGHARQKSRQAG